MCDDNIININKLQILFLGKHAYCDIAPRTILFLRPDTTKTNINKRMKNVKI